MKRTMLGWKESLRCRSTSSLNSCRARVFSPAFSHGIKQCSVQTNLLLYSGNLHCNRLGIVKSPFYIEKMFLPVKKS